MADELTPDLSLLADALADVEPGSEQAETLAAEAAAAVIPLTADEARVAARIAADAETIDAREAAFTSRVEPGDAERYASDEFLATPAARASEGQIGARGVLTSTWSQGVRGNTTDTWFHNGVQINKPGLTLVNCRVRGEISGPHPATFVRCTLSPHLADLPGHTFVDCNTKEL